MFPLRVGHLSSNRDGTVLRDADVSSSPGLLCLYFLLHIFTVIDSGESVRPSEPADPSLWVQEAGWGPLALLMR